MAVTLDLIKQTPLSLQYTVTQDGQAGTTVVLDSATLIADSVAGALRELLVYTTPGLDQDGARAIMLGDAGGLASQNLTNTPHATCHLTARSGAAQAYSVDADVDAVTITRAELNIAAAAAAGVAILDIQFRHTLTR